jgi:hypothetical protein
MENTAATLPPGANRDAMLAYARQRFVTTLAETASACGIRTPGLSACLIAAAGRAFDDLAGLRSREEFVKLRSLTASRISLVHPEDMDLTVAMINLAHDLSDACEAQLPKLHLLFMTLLDQHSSVVDQLPVGPDAVCAALRELCDHDEMPASQRLGIPERVEKPLARALNQLYADLTEAFTQAGVTPKSLLRSANETGGVVRAAQGLGGASSLPVAQDSTADGPLAQLQNNVLRKRCFSGEGGGSGMTDPALLQAILDQVTQWLTERQLDAAHQPYGAASAQVNLGELSGLLPASSNASLEALNLSFDALLLDKTLCSVIKPSLGRLRLPVCKAALLDGEFLAQADHPARRLLDVALRLAATLPLDEASAHPVCVAIEEAACRVQRNFANDVVIFADAAAPLEALEKSREADASARAAAFGPLAEREARREQARSRAARAIRALCAAAPPAPVQIFLERLWVRVLAAIHQTAGEKSADWVAALATANHLIESVQAKSDAEARQRLTAELPTLLAELRAGMESIATPPILAERAFQSFVALHSAALRGKAPDLSAYQDVLPPAMPPRVDTATDIPGLHVVRLSPDSDTERDLPDWIAQLQLGDWLLLSLPDQTPQRLRIGWIGGTPRLLLLTRPDDDFTVLMPLRWLVMRAAEQAASPLPMEAPFDRAAQAAIRLMQGYA